ncbi:hypothetical protein [Nonomuraea sp. B10E8]|uniref:hypothetical protein n=1 Tax=Nonomuraea sp. B10E8 TaxID=3153559 RepID=UPI00325F59F2
MNNPAPISPLPPEPPHERNGVPQMALTLVVIVIVLIWPDLIPMVTVVLAVLSLDQAAR